METKTSYSSEIPRKSSGKQRSVFINRAQYGGGYGGTGGSVISRSVSSSLSAGMPAGGYQVVSQTGVTNVKDARVKEKMDMQDLNERFASYIEKVRFLEAQNRKLADELEKLKSRWGKDTQAIKSMYEQELADLRQQNNDANTDKNMFEVKLADEAENSLRLEEE